MKMKKHHSVTRVVSIQQRDAQKAADRLAPTVREDLQAVRRRPLDAPMATRISDDFPDLMAGLAWEQRGYTVKTQPRDWTLVIAVCLILASFVAGVLVGGVL